MKKKKTGIILGSCAALAVLIVLIPIVTSLNTKVADYPYSPELTTPGASALVKRTLEARVNWLKNIETRAGN